MDEKDKRFVEFRFPEWDSERVRKLYERLSEKGGMCSITLRLDRDNVFQFIAVPVKTKNPREADIGGKRTNLISPLILLLIKAKINAHEKGKVDPLDYCDGKWKYGVVRLGPEKNPVEVYYRIRCWKDPEKGEPLFNTVAEMEVFNVNPRIRYIAIGTGYPGKEDMKAYAFDLWECRPLEEYGLRVEKVVEKRQKEKRGSKEIEMEYGHIDYYVETPAGPIPIKRLPYKRKVPREITIIAHPGFKHIFFNLEVFVPSRQPKEVGMFVLKRIAERLKQLAAKGYEVNVGDYEDRLFIYGDAALYYKVMKELREAVRQAIREHPELEKVILRRIGEKRGRTVTAEEEGEATREEEEEGGLLPA